MTIKEYLNQYMVMSKRIELIDQQIAEAQAERDSIAINLDGLPSGSGISDKTGRLASTIADLQEDLTDIRTAAWKTKSRILHTILSVDHEDYQQILLLRYINGMTWDSIADEMYYSRQWVTVLHGRALEYLRERTGLD